MKGVIFGRGFLGTRIANELGYELPELNVLHFDKLEQYLDEIKPDVVINAVGKTGRPNIDWCEDHKEETLLSNVAVALMVSVACSKRGIYFVHLGSGCIYQGELTGLGYDEEISPNNTGNIYVRSKILSEKLLKELPGLQLRIRMPLDDRPNERNFIDKVKKYSKVIDQQNSITTVPSMIEALKKLIKERKEGIYNFTNPGTMSAAEIMTMYKKLVNPKHEFEIITGEDLDEITKAKRSNCMLNTQKLENTGVKLPEIHEAVKECMINYKENVKQ